MAQTLSRPKNAFLTALVLMLAIVMAQPADARGSRDAQFDLKLGLNADRSEAIAMNGAGTRLDGEVAIFLETNIDTRYIRAVTFYINGHKVNRESRAPFDLGSTQRNGLANLVETAVAFDVGPQAVKAVVQRWFAYPTVIESTLNVLPAEPTIVETAAGNPDVSILVEALIAADLVDEVNGPGPITVFAPTNDAFVALLDTLGITKQQLFDNRPLLTTVLLYHLINQEVFAADVLAASEIFPMESEAITVDGDAAQLNGVNIVATDIDASNGVIHVIDGVLVPPAAAQLLGD